MNEVEPGDGGWMEEERLPDWDDDEEAGVPVPQSNEQRPLDRLPGGQQVAIAVLNVFAAITIALFGVGVIFHLMALGSAMSSLGEDGWNYSGPGEFLNVAVLDGIAIGVYLLGRAAYYMALSIQGVHVATDPILILRRFALRWLIDGVNAVLILYFTSILCLLQWPLVLFGRNSSTGLAIFSVLSTLGLLVLGIMAARWSVKRTLALSKSVIDSPDLPAGVAAEGERS